MFFGVFTVQNMKIINLEINFSFVNIRSKSIVYTAEKKNQIKYFFKTNSFKITLFYVQTAA